MGPTLKTHAIAFGSAVAMALAVELVRHYEERITDRADELVSASGRLYARALAEWDLEAEVRRAMPWVFWFAWEAQHDALTEGDHR
jgi:hypothetical protein